MMLSLLRMKKLLRKLSLLKRNTRMILILLIENTVVRNFSQPLKKLKLIIKRWKRRKKRKLRNSRQIKQKNK
jgi:hypothetical protein